MENYNPKWSSDLNYEYKMSFHANVSVISWFWYICKHQRDMYIEFKSQPLLSCVQGNALPWRHNERNGVSNHRPHYYLLNR